MLQEAMCDKNYESKDDDHDVECFGDHLSDEEYELKTFFLLTNKKKFRSNRESLGIPLFAVLKPIMFELTLAEFCKDGFRYKNFFMIPFMARFV